MISERSFMVNPEPANNEVNNDNYNAVPVCLTIIMGFFFKDFLKKTLFI